MSSDSSQAGRRKRRRNKFRTSPEVDSSELQSRDLQPHPGRQNQTARSNESQRNSSNGSRLNDRQQPIDDNPHGENAPLIQDNQQLDENLHPRIPNDSKKKLVPFLGPVLLHLTSTMLKYKRFCICVFIIILTIFLLFVIGCAVMIGIHNKISNTTNIQTLRIAHDSAYTFNLTDTWKYKGIEIGFESANNNNKNGLIQATLVYDNFAKKKNRTFKHSYHETHKKNITRYWPPGSNPQVLISCNDSNMVIYTYWFKSSESSESSKMASQNKLFNCMNISQIEQIYSGLDMVTIMFSEHTQPYDVEINETLPIANGQQFVHLGGYTNENKTTLLFKEMFKEISGNSPQLLIITNNIIESHSYQNDYNEIKLRLNYIPSDEIWILPTAVGPILIILMLTTLSCSIWYCKTKSKFITLALIKSEQGLMN